MSKGSTKNDEPVAFKDDIAVKLAADLDEVGGEGAALVAMHRGAVDESTPSEPQVHGCSARLLKEGRGAGKGTVKKENARARSGSLSSGSRGSDQMAKETKLGSEVPAIVAAAAAAHDQQRLVPHHQRKLELVQQESSKDGRGRPELSSAPPKAVKSGLGDSGGLTGGEEKLSGQHSPSRRAAHKSPSKYVPLDKIKPRGTRQPQGFPLVQPFSTRTSLSWSHGWNRPRPHLQFGQRKHVAVAVPSLDPLMGMGGEREPERLAFDRFTSLLRMRRSP